MSNPLQTTREWAEGIEDRRKTALVRGFAAIGCPFMFGFGVVSLLHARWALAIVLLGGTALVAALALTPWAARYPRRISGALAAFAFLLGSYLLVTGGHAGTGMYFSFTLSMLMVIFVGPRAGLPLMALYIGVVTVALLSDAPFVHPYPPEHALRIILATISLYLVVLTSEWIRVRSYDSMVLTSEDYRRDSLTDPLTGVLNRAGLEHLLQEWPRQGDATLAVIDIDHFKRINDRYGHDTGDQALIKVSQLLRSHIKGRDAVARWGGEEFLLLLPDTSLDGAICLVERIRQQLAETPLEVDGQKIALTFSAGVALMRPGDDLQSAFKTADKALFNAKEGGRNQVRSHQVPSSGPLS
ncbi:MAG TPA: GGDEF domain-containing protein [Gammaproteobacteria bacterium]|nr:GGDEF domain-containing protein [Gammaproteobacteria bacterium]